MLVVLVVKIGKGVGGKGVGEGGGNEMFLSQLKIYQGFKRHGLPEVIVTRQNDIWNNVCF